MNIQRINAYNDLRFSKKALNQHGCFLADDEPYEVEIISHHEAIIRGREERLFLFSPYDLQMIPREEYKIKWNQFCDDYFTARDCKPSVSLPQKSRHCKLLESPLS